MSATILFSKKDEKMTLEDKRHFQWFFDRQRELGLEVRFDYMRGRYVIIEKCGVPKQNTRVKAGRYNIRDSSS